VGPPLVTRALQGPTEASEWGSASSGVQIADEMLMASKFRKAVQYATHSANEGHRHQFQPQQYSFGYRKLQGLDTCEKCEGSSPLGHWLSLVDKLRDANPALALVRRQRIVLRKTP
jgi:hypothetical protein